MTRYWLQSWSVPARVALVAAWIVASSLVIAAIASFSVRLFVSLVLVRFSLAAFQVWARS